MNLLSGSRPANIVHIPERRIAAGRVVWKDGVIARIEASGPEDPGLSYLIPGFVDAHVHIESSMLVPSEFARLASRHGTVASVSDPHEIANVLGLEGVRFMLENARRVPFRMFFGAPSCVPATPFETAGAELGLEELGSLLRDDGLLYLSEMMNFPAVLARDPAVMAKIALARSLGLPVDGHAPGLTGEQARRYAEAGISTDHECASLEEARDKLAAGMRILIREGSAARNFDALHPLISSHPDQVMFCSDDKHPDDLARGHIDRLAARAVAAGHDPLDVLRCACLNPVLHYRLPLGLLRPGDPMDAAEVADLRDFRPLRTWIGGRLVAEAGRSLIDRVPVRPVNRFHARKIAPADLDVPAGGARLRVIAVRGRPVAHPRGPAGAPGGGRPHRAGPGTGRAPAHGAQPLPGGAAGRGLRAGLRAARRGAGLQRGPRLPQHRGGGRGCRSPVPSGQRPDRPVRRHRRRHRGRGGMPAPAGGRTHERGGRRCAWPPVMPP
jgi:adenine deaminase